MNASEFAAQINSQYAYEFTNVQFPLTQNEHTGEVTFTSGQTYSMTDHGFEYMRYRLNLPKHSTFSDDEINEAAARTFGSKQAVAAIVNGALYAIMDHYNPLTHTDLLTQLGDIELTRQYVDETRMEATALIIGRDGIAVGVKVTNGTAGTVAFGYRMTVYGNEWQFERPIGKTRHLSGLMDVKTAYDAAAEAVVAEDTFGKLERLTDFTLDENDVVSLKENEVLAATSGLNGYEALVKLDEYSQKRGYKGIARRYIDALLEAVS